MMAITRARPTVTSAAATAMIKSAKTAPAFESTGRNALKATRLRFTALNISSMLMSIRIALRRAMNPNVQIGRASCRERVEISVGARAVSKKRQRRRQDEEVIHEHGVSER